MFRKFALGFVATIALVGAIASMTTAASARGGHHGGGHGGGHHGWHHGGWHHGGGWHHRGRGWGPRFYIGGPAYYGGGCYVRRLVPTPWGPRWRTVNRCY